MHFVIWGLISKIKNNKVISRLDLDVSSTQKNAINLYKSFGFKKIGVKHKEIKDKGLYYDQVVMEKFIK